MSQNYLCLRTPVLCFVLRGNSHTVCSRLAHTAVAHMCVCVRECCCCIHADIHNRIRVNTVVLTIMFGWLADAAPSSGLNVVCLQQNIQLMSKQSYLHATFLMMCCCSRLARTQRLLTDSDTQMLRDALRRSRSSQARRQTRSIAQQILGLCVNNISWSRRRLLLLLLRRRI